METEHTAWHVSEVDGTAADEDQPSVLSRSIDNGVIDNGRGYPVKHFKGTASATVYIYSTLFNPFEPYNRLQGELIGMCNYK